jgi:small neutral amino acid transporter SnatA (MarC family)
MQSDGAFFTAFVGLLVYAAVLPVLFLAPLVEKALGRVAVLVVSRILYIFIAAKAATFVIEGMKALWSGAAA